ncbi:MAG: hypothetical protein WC994_02720 [Brumimicrobium sp.]
MKKILPLFILPLFFACNSNSKNNELCDCVAAGAEADSISAYYLVNEQTLEGKEALEKAIEKRDKICLQFENMLGHELQEMAQDCEELKVKE